MEWTSEFPKPIIDLEPGRPHGDHSLSIWKFANGRAVMGRGADGNTIGRNRLESQPSPMILETGHRIFSFNRKSHGRLPK